MNLRQMNLPTEKNLLHYFYHINTDFTLKLPVDSPSNPQIFLQIFNEAENRIKKFNPSINNDFYGNGISKIHYASIKKILFSQCILDTIISFKSYLLDGQKTAFTHGKQSDLYWGYFSRPQNISKVSSLLETPNSLSKFMWQKIRDKTSLIAKDTGSETLHARLFNLIIPDFKDWGECKKWFLPTQQSDFIYHVLTNPDISEFLNMIELRLNKKSFTKPYNETLNKQLSVCNLTDSMNFYWNSTERNTRNDFFLFHEDPVDRLIFAQEMEHTFHFSLYHYLLSEKTISHFTDGRSYTNFLRMIKYMKQLPNALTATHILEYAISNLDNEPETYKYDNFLEVLKDSGRPIKPTPVFMPVNTYFTWLDRTKQTLIYYATLFIPLLERTFLLLLLDAYNLDITNIQKLPLKKLMEDLHDFAINSNEKSLFWNDTDSESDISDLSTTATPTEPGPNKNIRDNLSNDPQLCSTVINGLYTNLNNTIPENNIHTTADKFLGPDHRDMYTNSVVSNYIGAIIDSHFDDYVTNESKQI